MAWLDERKCLVRMRTTPNKNSVLRKKLSIVKKLKCITSEEFEQLFEEIQSEDLRMFYSEIINGFLTPQKAQSTKDVHLIVRVLYYFTGDPSFISKLGSVYRKQGYTGWIQAAIFTEVYYLFHNTVKDIVTEVIERSGSEYLFLIDYMLESFEDLDKSLFERDVKQELGRLSNKNIGILKEICLKLGWSEYPEIPTNYKEVVREVEGEFDFYRKKPLETKRRFEAGDIKKIDSQVTDIEFLDSIGRAVSESPELLQRILRKKRSRESIPGVARIMMHTKHERSSMIARLLEPSSDSVIDIFYLCEFCKFDVIRPSLLVARGEQLLKEHSIDKLCALIEGAGRYLLIHKESNEGMRRLLSSLTSNSLSDTESILVNDALAKLYAKPKRGLSLTDFFHWFFLKENLSGQTFAYISSSRRLLALLYVSPQMFSSIDLLASFITSTGMQSDILDIYIDSIEDVYRHSKQFAFLFMSTASLLIAPFTSEEQSAIIERVFQKNIPKSDRHAMIISLLENCTKSIYSHFIAKIHSDSPHSKTRTLLFNFCAKHTCFVQEDDPDSFERELEYMTEI